MITPCLSAEVAYVYGPRRPRRRHTTIASFSIPVIDLQLAQPISLTNEEVAPASARATNIKRRADLRPNTVAVAKSYPASLAVFSRLRQEPEQPRLRSPSQLLQPADTFRQG
jgi:hypothetical protein